MEKIEYLGCFFCGNLLTVSMIPTQTLVETVILGLLGGFVAMLSKDIYNYVKNLLNRR
jgi:hypothetical protein|tara:strand:+ start:569 stop:742 length:174 start_codon:yes stop_codon:yes gene_type:complete